MNRNETLAFLDEIASIFPAFLKGRDPKKVAAIWQECLQFQDAKECHWAFIRYLQEDTRNLPPCPGVLIEILENSIPFTDDAIYEITEDIDHE